MARFDLSDEEWSVIQPLLPKKGRGPVRKDNRLVLNGIYLVPDFDGALFSPEWTEAIWDKFYTEAPRQRTPFEQQYCIHCPAGFAPGRSAGRLR